MRTTYTILFALAIGTLMLPSGFNTAPNADAKQLEMDRRANQPAVPAPTVESAKPTFGPGEAIEQVRRYYRSSLLDYRSAQFEWSDFTGDRLVFSVNAKNGFGAYTGRRRMVAVFVNGKLSRIAG